MKKIFIVIYFGLYIFSLMSCNKKTFEPVVVDLAGNITATVNGVEWNSGLEASFIVDDLKKKMILTGHQAYDQNFRKTLTLHIEDVGTGSFQSDRATAYFTDSQTGASWVSTAPLNVQIEKLDYREAYSSGAFSFQAVNPVDNSVISISGGRFTDVRLISQ